MSNRADGEIDIKKYDEGYTVVIWDNECWNDVAGPFETLEQAKAFSQAKTETKRN